MEKLQGTSMDIVQDNIEKLKQIFPEIFTEGKIDFQVLKQLLGEHIENDKERYSFTWKGKTQARQIAQDMSTGTLRPDRDNSKDWENTENLYIEGDNLEVLKLLQKSYHGKIKMIYIDPPYNTGKDFVYKDNFRDNIDNYLTITGQKSENSTGGGYKLTTNLESNGRYHSDWLNMMYPRLKLARNLLTDDGVIFISIDDNEVTNLKKICDEIFGEENFISNLIWQKNFAPKNDNKYISNSTENIFLIAKLKDSFKRGLLPREEKHNLGYNNPDNDIRGVWTSGSILATTFSEKSVFEIIAPNGKRHLPTNGRCWRFSKEKIKELQNDNRLWFGTDGNGVPRIKRFLSEMPNGIVPQNLMLYQEVGSNQDGNKELTEIFNTQIFNFPKNIKLMNRLFRIADLNTNDIVFDFFSGSATTAHAVMQLNAEDGGNRKYIMVQLPEVCDEKSEAYKAGYKNICEIGKERIRRAGEKIKSDETLPAENREKLDIGFKVFKLDSSNIKEWDSETEDLKQSLFDSIDNIKSDRTSLDILYEILLKYGLDLNVPIVENKYFYSIGGGTLLINLDKEIDMEVIDSICEEYKTLLEIDEDFKTTVVLRDSSFANDVDKTNAMKKLEQVGINEVRSI